MFVSRDEKHAQLQALETSTICYPRILPSRSTSVWFVVFVSERVQIPGIYMCIYIYIYCIYCISWPLTWSFFHHVLFFMLHMHAFVMMAGLCYGWDVTVGTLCGSLKTSCWLWEGIRSQTRFAVALVCPLNPQRPDHISTEAGNHRMAVVDPCTQYHFQWCAAVLSVAAARKRADGALWCFMSRL